VNLVVEFVGWVEFCSICGIWRGSGSCWGEASSPRFWKEMLHLLPWVSTSSLRVSALVVVMRALWGALFGINPVLECLIFLNLRECREYTSFEGVSLVVNHVLRLCVFVIFGCVLLEHSEMALCGFSRRMYKVHELCLCVLQLWLCWLKHFEMLHVELTQWLSYLTSWTWEDLGKSSIFLKWAI